MPWGCQGPAVVVKANIGPGPGSNIESEVSTHIIAVRAWSLYYVVIRTFPRYLAEPYAADIFVNQK